jgi:hypothetical protein
MLDTKRITTRGRSRLPGLAALALGLLALGAPAPAFAQDAPKENGFALNASLGARFSVLALGGAGVGAVTIGLPTFQAGLMAGYKVDRIVIGLGIEFSNTTSNTTNQSPVPPVTTTSTTTSNSTFLIGPELQAALVRSADRRVELIADASIHFGHAFQNVSVTITPPPPPVTGPSGPTESNFLLSYAIGPGVRYWPHQHFALQAITGFGGQAYFDLPVNGNPATGNNSQHGIFTTFGALGVF